VSRSIQDRARFDLVRYANCWEDADVLCEALAPAPARRVLSIASAGDNAFALLAEGAEVVAADLSPAQLACVELKAAAIRRLDREDLLAFLGIRPAADRGAVYRALRGALTEAARAFWDAHGDDVAYGIVHAGRFERFFHFFRRRILPLVHSRRRIAELQREKTADERAAFYEAAWNTWRWRLLFRIAMSRFVMGRLGRDPEFFRYVEGSVGDRILARTGRALSSLPLHENPYLDYILNGNFTRSLPRYLRADTLDDVRAGLDRLTLRRGPAEEAAAAHGPFDGFNLSDIFEYLDEDTCATLYAALLDAARPGARLAYWNMLVPRRCPDALRGRVRPLDARARDLFAHDAAFFYSAFVVEEVQ